MGNTHAEVALCGQNLRKHFGRQQMATETADGGSAKGTAHFTAELSGNTNRITVFIFHHNAFNVFTLV